MSAINLSALSTIQFRLDFKDKGYKSPEYCCLYSINTFDIRKYNFLRWIELWYFYPYCAIRHYKYKDKRILRAIWQICQQYNFAWFSKAMKSLEYLCLVIHLTSVNTISYAESNGGIFILILRQALGITNTISCFTLQLSRPHSYNRKGLLLDEFYIDMTPICFS
jgi:hypothetical protein